MFFFQPSKIWPNRLISNCQFDTVKLRSEVCLELQQSSKGNVLTMYLYIWSSIFELWHQRRGKGNCKIKAIFIQSRSAMNLSIRSFEDAWRSHLTAWPSFCVQKVPSQCFLSLLGICWKSGDPGFHQMVIASAIEEHKTGEKHMREIMRTVCRWWKRGHPVTGQTNSRQILEIRNPEDWNKVNFQKAVSSRWAKRWRGEKIDPRSIVKVSLPISKRMLKVLLNNDDWS